ncbi:MAG: histidine triad nucleotide-binding protein [Gammaproteobacteria bacterium]
MDNKNTLFTKIINREIPAEIIYEDDLCIAFRDINPQAPLHALLVPKQVLGKLSDGSKQEQLLLGHLMLTAPLIAEQQGYADAFRIVINNGEAAGQTVFHLHIHIIAGRDLNWPPG